MAYQVCTAVIQRSQPCLPTTLTLFLFDPFIDRAKPGDLLDVNAYVMPIVKWKGGKPLLKEIRAVVFNLAPCYSIPLNVHAIFKKLGLTSTAYLKTFRAAPPVKLANSDMAGVSMVDTLSTIAS